MIDPGLAKELSGLAGKTLSANRKAVERAGEACRAALAGGGQILVFGNGGSAAEAQHFAAELVNQRADFMLGLLQAARLDVFREHRA